jgi:cytochrome c biogenesis protein
VRKVDLRESIDSRLGAANKTVTKKELRNVGPSITYKLRDAAGQAREFHNYMLPVDMGDGAAGVPAGRARTPAEPFRYLRVPADDQGEMDGFLRSCVRRCRTRPCASRRCAAMPRKATDPPPARAGRAAGQSARARWRCSPGPSRAGRQATGGLQAMSDFMEPTCPRPSARAGEVLLRILNGVLFELAQLSREARRAAAAGARRGHPGAS